LVDLENIETLFTEKANEAARVNKAKVSATVKLAGEQVPRKGKQTKPGSGEPAQMAYLTEEMAKLKKKLKKSKKRNKKHAHYLLDSDSDSDLLEVLLPLA